ncbi:hypothetical protein [Kibdelosporangium phytohabitans]|uniref:Uncharacterized protein n=1 Tax=Kibdelosporangium phytohabitans TaxID=860235 RepID=A0A0N9I6A4_9PSEU|nr:hypothetical protein [Kibdelosporangium phytohabitans]ALG10272.1 hypothetical protein AOZ06_28280 [Kibdelosporangium phytohabitans]MBE1461302.1 hypothetical protein [Kibdelosporangium phytohabitans]
MADMTSARTVAASTTVVASITAFAAAVLTLLYLGLEHIDFMSVPQELTPGERTVTWIACGAAILAPVIGIVAALGGKLRRSRTADAMVAMLAVGVIASLLSIPHSAPAGEPLPADRRCQEHSGGDTRCPGG